MPCILFFCGHKSLTHLGKNMHIHVYFNWPMFGFPTQNVCYIIMIKHVLSNAVPNVSTSCVKTTL